MLHQRRWFLKKQKRRNELGEEFIELYTATLIPAKGVIPAKAGIQKNTGFRVKPGMTNYMRLISSCIGTRLKERPVLKGGRENGCFYRY